MKDILANLERFGISAKVHGQTSLLAHLKGTQEILRNWDCPRYVCLAGLCHSIYGTESYSQTPATLDNREYVRDLIGEDAEHLAYLFGVHVKESLWVNLNRSENFWIEDRFTNEPTAVSEQELRDLVTVTLANWLEQRPRADSQYHFIRQEEFLRSKRLLPAKGFQEFLAAYGLSDS